MKTKLKSIDPKDIKAGAVRTALTWRFGKSRGRIRLKLWTDVLIGREGVNDCQPKINSICSRPS